MTDTDIETGRGRTRAAIAAARGLVLVAATGLAACSASLPSGLSAGAVPEKAATPVTTAVADITTSSIAGSTSGSTQTRSSQTAPRMSTVRELAKASAENPKDPTLARAYVRALKGAGKRAEALAVLESASEANPAETSLGVEQGLLALELGQSGKALNVLRKVASGPVQDWRVLSALGIAASTEGDQREAQRHFAKALELSQNNPAVLNNLAMSLILERKLDQAESMLRRAAKAGAGRQRVAQNLGLIKALRSEAGDDQQTSRL